MKPRIPSRLSKGGATYAPTLSVGVSITWRGLNNGHLPSQCDPRVRELAIDLRFGKDLSGPWVTMHG
jgi:hypothetical protein